MRFLLYPIALCICGAIGYGVYQYAYEESQREGDGKKGGRKLAVEVAPIIAGTVEERIELVGGLEPKAQVTIRSRARGYITRLPFDIGDEVGSDGKLPVVVEIDDSTLKETLKGSLAALRVAEAQLESKRAQLLLAESVFNREKNLAKNSAISVLELERAESQVKIAKAEVSLEEARVAEAKSTVERSRIQLDELKLETPLAGHIAQRLVDVGDLANPDDPLVQIVDISTVRTIVHVVEKDYEKVAVGQKVDVRIDALEGELLTGTVVRRAPVLNPETRTGAVHIEIPNPKGRLKPGMHARVSIVTTRHKDVAIAPLTALLEHTAEPSVYVISGSPPKAELRTVKVGIYARDHVEIVKGLNEGEKVVTLGSHIVEEGQEVTPVFVEGAIAEKTESNQPIRGD